MENIFDNKWNKDFNDENTWDDSVAYTGNENLPRYSSGSRWQDALLGLGAGLSELNPSNTPNRYFVDTNYIGNGLAKSSSAGGIGSIKNDKYRDPYDLLNYWQSKLRQNKYGKATNTPLPTLIGSAFDDRILGNIGTIDVLPQYKYPTSIYDNSDWYVPNNTIKAYREPEANDYLQTGKYSNFRNKLSDYFGNFGGVVSDIYGGI